MLRFHKFDILILPILYCYPVSYYPIGARAPQPQQVLDSAHSGLPRRDTIELVLGEGRKKAKKNLEDGDRGGGGCLAWTPLHRVIPR